MCLGTNGRQSKEYKMDLKFITELNESNQYRTKQVFKQLDARIVADNVFMDMIALWILYNEFSFAPAARNYASNTVTFNRFSNFRQMGTDLYLGFHILSEKRTDLLGTAADLTLMDRIHLDIPGIVRYLRMATDNTLTPSMVRITLQRLEVSLQIDDSNYRSIRRLAQSWPKLSTAQKRSTITRMSFFYRTHARRSELYQLLDSFARSAGLYDHSANNPEVSNALKAAAAATAAAGVGFAAGYQLGKALL